MPEVMAVPTKRTEVLDSHVPEVSVDDVVNVLSYTVTIFAVRREIQFGAAQYAPVRGP